MTPEWIDSNDYGSAVAKLGALAEHPSELAPVLHWLHYADEPKSRLYRQWLASTVYDRIEATVDRVRLEEALDEDELVRRLTASQTELSPLKHPLFVLLYDGQPTFEQVKLYFRQKWLIMTSFWSSIAEFGHRLPASDLVGCALVYKNVFEELGDGDPSRAHLQSHLELMRSMNVDVDFDSPPEFVETLDYINFRMFCMRHPEPAWGLGSLYSQEATSLEYTLGHADLLARFGVREERSEIYVAHDSIDTEHTDEVVQLVRHLVKGREAQEALLTAQRHQMVLWNRHFDRVYERALAMAS